MTAAGGPDNKRAHDEHGEGGQAIARGPGATAPERMRPISNRLLLAAGAAVVAVGAILMWVLVGIAFRYAPRRRRACRRHRARRWSSTPSAPR